MDPSVQTPSLASPLSAGRPEPSSPFHPPFGWESSEGAADGLRLRSRLPGRERWEVGALRRRPEAVSHLRMRLSSHASVTAVEANPVTGRVLVLYDPAIGQVDIADRLRRAVAESLESTGASTAPASRRSGGWAEGGVRIDATMAALTVGGSLAAAALALGASALATVALAGAGVLSVAVTARGLRQQQEYLTSTLDTDGRSDRRHPLLALARYAQPYRRQVAIASACSVLKKIFDIAPPLLIGLSINVVATGGMPAFAAIGLSTLWAQLGAIGVLTVAAFGFESIFEFAQKALWRQIAQKIQRDLRVDTYERVQAISLANLDEESLGEVAVPLTEQINQIETFVNGGLDALLQLSTNVVLLIGLFVVVVPNMAWIAAVPVPFLLWRTFRFQRTMAPLYAETERTAGLLNKQVVSNILGLQTIRSFCAEDHENRRIRELSQDYVDSHQPAIHEFALFLPTFRLPVVAAFTGIIWIGGASVGAGTLAVGNYALMLFLIQRFLFPFAYLGEIVDVYQRTMAAVDRVFELYELPSGPESGDRPLPLSEVRGEIVFDEVSFAYPNGQTILADFSLHIPAGATVALVGPTGVGKSTIVRILLRFYELSSGSVRLDGHDIRSLSTRDLRAAISLVSQDLFLFDGTVFDNIDYGTFGATVEEIEEAARIAQATEFIEALPQQYRTRIGEGGKKLSTGQRQRLCLARAMVKLNRARIIVLDEATSAVDSRTEEEFRRSFDRVTAERTALLIAHRLSTVRGADQIYVLGEHGQIVEHGDHEELLQRNGFYARLWRLQSDESALADALPANLRQISSP